MDKSIKELAEQLSLLASGKEREKGNVRKDKTSSVSVHSGKTAKKDQSCKTQKCSVAGCKKSVFGFYQGEAFCSVHLKGVQALEKEYGSIQ